MNIFPFRPFLFYFYDYFLKQSFFFLHTNTSFPSLPSSSSPYLPPHPNPHPLLRLPVGSQQR